MTSLSSRLVSLLLSFTAVAAPEIYTLDPTHTNPNFSVQHLGMSTVWGHFERATGKVVIDRAAKTGSIEVKIPTAFSLASLPAPCPSRPLPLLPRGRAPRAWGLHSSRPT